MQITVTIPDALAAQVQERGLNLTEHLRALLVADLASAHSQTGPEAPVPSKTSELKSSAVDAMQRFAADHGFTTAGLNLKGLAHEGHKY